MRPIQESHFAQYTAHTYFRVLAVAMNRKKHRHRPQLMKPDRAGIEERDRIR